MAARPSSEAPLRALVLSTRTELAALEGLLAPHGVETAYELGDGMPGEPPPSLAILDGVGSVALDERVRALRAGGAKVVALAGSGAEDELGNLYRAGADVVFGAEVDPHHLFLQCCALLRIWDVERREVRVGRASFEPRARRLHVENRPVRLTEAEAGILSILVDRRPGFADRDSISERVFAIPYDRFDRRIDVHVSNLRRKLRENEVGAAIETSRLNGFRLFDEPPGSHGAAVR